MLPIDVENLKAVLVDVDGTLYRQGPVRRAILCRLIHKLIQQPKRGVATIRVLRAYRKAQEKLRSTTLDRDDLANAQLRLACEWTGVELEKVTSCVVHWMERAPLEFLAGSLRHGVVEFLRAASDQGLRLAVFSDYPAVPKLVAMGVANFFDIVVTAQDPEVQKFKPNPRGLQVTLERLGVEKHQALYIGDRPETDGAAAHSAGLPCVIIGRRNVMDQSGWIEVSGYGELKNVICGG